MASTNEYINRKETLRSKISTLTKYLIELQNELDDMENKESILQTVSPFGTKFLRLDFNTPLQSFSNGLIQNKFDTPNQPVIQFQTSSLDTTKSDSIDSNYFVFSNKNTHYV